MKGQGIGTLAQFDNDWVVDSLRCVVLREFGAEAARLYAHERIEMRIKISRPAEDLGGNLIFLECDSRLFDGVFGEITKELAERLGSLKSMAVYQLLYLEKARFQLGYMTRNAHLTKRNKLISLLSTQQLTKT